MDFIQREVVLTLSDFINKEIELVSLAIKSVFGNDADVVILPKINDPKINVPRLILRYPQKGININVLNNQIGFIDTKNSPKFFDQILSVKYDELDMHFIRVGLVDTFFEQGDIKHKQGILNERFAKLPINELNVRICQVINLCGYVCNNIDKVDTGQATQQGNPGNPIAGFIIQRDVNTSQHSRNIITVNTVGILLNEFATKTQDITLKCE